MQRGCYTEFYGGDTGYHRVNLAYASLFSNHPVYPEAFEVHGVLMFVFDFGFLGEVFATSQIFNHLFVILQYYFH